MKPLNIKKLEISGPAARVGLSMRRESFSSRIRNSFCSWVETEILL